MKPNLWCPMCKKFVEKIYEMLPDGEYYTSNRIWDGGKCYAEIDNSIQ